MKNNSFHCFIGVEGITMGKIQVIGNYLPKETRYSFNTFILHYVKDNQTVKLDLLK